MQPNQRRHQQQDIQVQGKDVRAVTLVVDLRRYRSYRRFPHHTWEDAFTLNLLFGLGKGRYLGWYRPRSDKTLIPLPGFSAGSYTGLALLHILQEIPCIVTESS